MVVAHLIDTLAWGGAQKLLVDFANAAVPRGLNVLVIVLRKNMDSPYPALLEKAGARVEFLSIKTLFDLSAIPRLLRILRTEHVDILHTHLSQANILGGLAGSLAGIPVVTTLHNVWLPSKTTSTSAPRAFVERTVLRFLTKKLIAVGHIVADTHQSVFPAEKLCTIPNPVDMLPEISDAKRDELRQEMAGDSHQKIILAIGRLILQKGYSQLIAAFAEVHKRHPGATLIFAGDGYLRDELTAQAKSLALNGSVRFLGNRKDVPRLLGASDLYVNSSHWEGLSIGMLEAMASGTPVLATSVGDAPYLLADGRGVLVPADDMSSFATEFSRLLDQPDKLKELGRRGQAYVEEYHSVGAWVDALVEMYTGLTGKSL